MTRVTLGLIGRVGIWAGAILTLGFGSVAATTSPSDSTTGIQQLNRLLTSYLKTGSTPVGNKLCLRLIEQKELPVGRSVDRSDFLSNIESALPFLYKRVQLEDTVAIKLVLLFRRFTDGAVAEQLDGSFGDLLPKNPVLFLRMLQRFVPTSRPDFDYILFPKGEKFSDKTLERLKEIERREISLKSVHSLTLLSERDTCIAILQQDRSQFMEGGEDPR